MVWKRMAFDKYQDCCLVLGHPDIFLKKKLLEEFQDGCLMHGHL